MTVLLLLILALMVFGAITPANGFWLIVLLAAVTCVNLILQAIASIFGSGKPREVHHHHYYVYNNKGGRYDEVRHDPRDD